MSPGPDSRTRPATRSQVAAWCLYDFANSSFTTLVVTFVYATWFTKAMAPDEVTGTGRWSWAVTLSALIIAFAAPVIGARADRRASRKRWLVGLTLTCITATALLGLVAPPRWLLALGLFVAANVAYELGQALYNAFLPGLVDRRRLGLVSGIAWGLGYAGGLLSLVFGLLLCVWRVGPMAAWLPDTDGFNIRAANLVVAAWFLLFSLPALLLLPEPAPPDPRAAASFRQLGATLRRLAGYRQAMRLLVARLVYNDGLVTIFAFGGIYAAGTFDMSMSEIIGFGITLNLAAGAGALFFGMIDDRVGGKTVIALSLVGLIGATLIAAMAPTRTWLWVGGVAIGLLVGPNQSASRSLMARFVPPPRSAEFFGLYAFSGKLTSFAGPFLLGRLTTLAGSQRIGVASVLLFFVAGGLLLWRIDEEAGKRQAEQEEALLPTRISGEEPP
ncbi:MAG: MFS transporter [Acidobacteriota bacterium]|nr:MFS transporter [Acidobacteriota bacterium]